MLPDHAGDPRAQDQDLRVPRDGRRRREQAGEEDKGTICHLTRHIIYVTWTQAFMLIIPNVALLLGQVAAGCSRKQHHHRGEQQEGQRETVPLGGCRRYEVLLTAAKKKSLNCEIPMKKLNK